MRLMNRPITGIAKRFIFIFTNIILFFFCFVSYGYSHSNNNQITVDKLDFVRVMDDNLPGSGVLRRGVVSSLSPRGEDAILHGCGRIHINTSRYSNTFG